MSDVFVSYAREDRALVEPFVAMLEQQGWSVWWDREIDPGATFSRAIEQEISAARCVVVLWTQRSVESDWVHAEANEGLERRILFPVLLEETRVPLIFRTTQTSDLRGWPGNFDEHELGRLLDALGQALEHPPEATKASYRSTAATRWTARRLGAAALLLAVATFLGIMVARSPPDATASGSVDITNGSSSQEADPEAETPPLLVSIESFSGLDVGVAQEIVELLARTNANAIAVLAADAHEPDLVLRGVATNERLTASLFDEATQRTRQSFTVDLQDDGLQTSLRNLAQRIGRELGGSPLPVRPVIAPELYLEYLSIRTRLRDAPTAEAREQRIKDLDALLNSAPRFAEGIAALCSWEIEEYLRRASSAAFERAERRCARATRLDADNPWVELALGNLYRAAGQLDAAENSYRRALEVAPYMTRALAGLAGVAADRGDIEGAESLLFRAQDIEPGSWSLFAFLGHIYFDAGSYEAAAAQYSEAVRLSRDNASMLADLGAAYFMQERFDDAVVHWRRSADLDQNAQTWSNLASAHYFEGNLVEALDAYQHAIDLDESDYRLWLNAGEAATHVSGADAEPYFARASELGEQLRQINPDANEVISALALASAALGNEAQARALLDELSGKESLEVDALYDMAVTHTRLGDARAARAAITTLVAQGYPRSLVDRDANFKGRSEK